LHYRAGDEETALDSLHALFDITRRTIETQGPGCRHLATLAVYVVNNHIRPLTAKWHKKKSEGRLLNDDDRREFRRELEQVRLRSIEFCRLLGSIAEGDAFKGIGVEEPGPKPADTEALDRPIPFDRILFTGEVPNYDRLFSGERVAIRARRGSYANAGIDNLAGLACSGGGIRSATFCLGIAQSLAQRGVLPRIDYLSTVSGGGYFGSFLSSYLNDPDRDAVGLEPGKLPFEQAEQPEAPPIRALRNNSKYLLKGGLLGQSRIAGLLLFGMLVNVLTLLPFLFGALTVTKVLQLAGVSGRGFHWFIGLGLAILSIVLVGSLVQLPTVYRKRAESPESIARYERRTILVSLWLLAVWALGWLMPSLYANLRGEVGAPSNVFWLFVALPFVLAGAAFSLGQEKLTGRILFFWPVPAVPCSC
jgi:hypothetical protein